MVYEDIYKIFPEIHEIKDKVLQQKSADALISAMEIGGWDGESVYLAPVTMNWQGCTCSLVEHIAIPKSIKLLPNIIFFIMLFLHSFRFVAQFCIQIIP